ncbi:MAG: preprotein translocase subunit SecY [Halobacteriota archaeon]|nr:preprotein translocase subunit SecY [Halobacteriota archaeon]
MSEVGFKDRLEPVLKRLPAVERPKGHVHFRTKMMWTITILLLYFVLCNVPLFGLSQESIDIFEQFRAFFAGTSGSLMMLGIGPIVTASIILQLLVGAEVIKLDLGDPRDQAIFQGAQKLLVFVMIVVETIPQIVGGFVKPDLQLAATLGIQPSTLTMILFLQICIGGILVLFMDEIISKWGIGSGVGLFIVAGISWGMVTGIFNWNLASTEIAASVSNLPIGLVPKWAWISSNMGAEQLLGAGGISFIFLQGGILALISTIAIFLIVVYIESTRIELPLSHSAVRGARGRFPVKLIYASVLPMILVRALQANVQMVGMLLARRGITAFGTYAEGNTPVSGLMYYLNPVRGPTDWIPSMVTLSFQDLGVTPPEPWQIALRLCADAAILIVGGIVFAIFWVQTANMGPKDVAKQIQRSGMQIPGFRRDIGVIEKVMKRYIPKVTIIGGAIIGGLVLVTSLLGTIGNVGGTGLLLTVSIVYRLYEDLAKEQMMEMHPMIRRFLGEE